MKDGNGRRNTYLRSLRTHAHELIALGYQELHTENYTSSEEPEITGELVRAMRQVQEGNLLLHGLRITRSTMILL
jgi:hypothetical protein